MAGSIVFRILGVLCLLVSVSLPAGAQDADTTNLESYLDEALLKTVFPDADEFGPVEGDPPAAAVYKGGELIGYVYEQYDVVAGVGYSKRPFHIVVGLDLTGHLTSVRLTMHVEPIAILGRTDDDFHNYLTQFSGIDIRHGVSVVLDMSGSVLEGEKFAMRGTAGDTSRLTPVDAVSRTTTSSILFSDSIIRGARLVARSRGISLAETDLGTRLDLELYEEKNWAGLIEDGSLSHLSLTMKDVADAFAGIEGAKAPRKVRLSPDEDLFMDLYAGLISPAGIGINVLGRTWYDQYTSGRNIDDMILFVASNGYYQFQDTEVDEAEKFTRIRLMQGDKEIPIGMNLMKTLPFHHAKEAPDLQEIGLLFFTDDSGFDPIQPWRLELDVFGDGPDDAPAVTTFGLDYQLPAQFIRPEAPAPAEPVAEADEDGETVVAAADPAAGETADAEAGAEASAATSIDWRSIWANNTDKIAILIATLAVLVLILSFQDAIARHRRLHKWIRIAFLAWVLVWLGWIAGAQLTIISLLNIAQSVVFDFDLAFFMVEPLIFILMAFVAVGLFLWGRAIFCGWLCPFGALQELLNKIAVALKIPQIKIPEAIQERLISVKYLIFLGLLGLTFYSFDLAIAGTNVEPFKTAITFRFDAPAAAVAYALVLLGIGLFVERFYCRVMCPLGAGLAILGRVRMFDWLKRRPECGNPCHRCEAVCPTGAIKSSGLIDMNECFYCLDCQVTYYDDHECPPLAARRKRLDALTPGDPQVQPAE